MGFKDQKSFKPAGHHAHSTSHGVGPLKQKARVRGFWYYLVLVATAGAFAWVPFLHAALRLKTAKARRFALIFGGLDALMYVLLAITPRSDQGQTVDGPISTVGGLLALGVVIVGCLVVTPLRRMVYDGVPGDDQGQLPNTDPAVRAALAARARRDETRKLAADDPLLARELHVGRPDLAGSYDDGGLVDLNGAPAPVIAEVCGIPLDVAATIVDTRSRRGAPFTSVDEVLVVADLPVSAWDRIRDRAVLIP